MFSSDDEQDDNGIFDQLKSIKPFTVDQLYLLHPDVGCPSIDQHDETDATINHDNELYAILNEYEHLRLRLAELRNDVKKLHRRTFEHVDKAWIFKEESVRKIGLCQSGEMAETTFNYKQAVINNKQLELFSLGFSKLSQIISKEYIYYSFESQMKRHKIATQLSISYQTQDKEERKIKLKSAISTLIEFLRYLGDSKSDFVAQCRGWLRALAMKFLEEGTTEDYRFIVSQIAKGPVGTSDWTADLIEYKPYDQVSGFDSVPQYITHCSALLSQLFHSLRSRVSRASLASCEENLDQPNVAQSTASCDQNWSLIDPRFNCSEELNVTGNNSNILSEVDVIKLCLKISVPQIFRDYVKKCLTSDEFRLETDKNYEFIMLKLLTIGTIIIKTYQIGLETFNSIQYGNLIEYLSSQARCTVIILSNQWTEFKSRLRGVDDALLMRLQVEYDNFILRSILIILELRESGIWRHLSRLEPSAGQDDEGLHSWTTDSLRPAFNRLLQVTGLSAIVESTGEQPSSNDSNNSTSPTKQQSSPPRCSSNSLTYEFSTEWFREVSEPMLWHILWQFYHNAFVSSCDYHSDNYWLEKFQENSVVYLFVNKIRDSPPGECSYLINSITSMLLSRTRSDCKIVDFIATVIFNLSFKYPELKSKVTSKGIGSLIRCAERFPSLISVYISLMIGENVDGDVVELLRECSLSGWLCNDDEVALLATWLIEFPLNSPQNKVARLIISKILSNTPEVRPATSTMAASSTPNKKRNNSLQRSQCFVDLKLRRTMALLLYEASRRQLPEVNEFSPQSLGASVEVAFGGLYCENNAKHECNLTDLATDVNYQQFYVWTWRLLFSLRLHILNQPETDWNDVRSRSGTSRSIKNTVLPDDSFHPTPSIQDSECLTLSTGLRDLNPMACYIYLMLTDATWQTETLPTCLEYLNLLVNTGHLTPSLMAMKFLTICHLDDLSLDQLMKQDKLIIEYFTSIITSNYDSTRLASLIASQLFKLKPFRQLELSQFYINILLEVSTIVSKQISSSWFSGNEMSLEKVACLLDYLVKFNFATQRLEIRDKFYECSYSIQDTSLSSPGGWFSVNSIFASNSSNVMSSTKREFLTSLHVLTGKFKKYLWLRWATIECDSLRLKKIWEEIVVYLSGNENASLDVAIKKVCPQMNANILKQMLPIYSWIRLIFDMMETGHINHPLSPLVWYNFYLNYFANPLNGGAVGNKLVAQETRIKLMFGLDSLFKYHSYKHMNWASTSGMQQNSLAQLYRAYKLWLQDSSLLEAYVDLGRLRKDYWGHLLEAVMQSSTEESCMQYIDIQTIEDQNRNLIQVWSTATQLNATNSDKMIFLSSAANNQDPDESMEILATTSSVVDDEASDALVAKVTGSGPPATSADARFAPPHQERAELAKPLDADLSIDRDQYRSLEEMMSLVKRNFNLVFEESTLFGLNLIELDKTKTEIIALVQELYSNKRREFVRVIPCSKGGECIGPARIKLEVEEAHLDERKSQCVQDRRRQCQELVGELLLMPKNRTVQATVVIEENVKRLIGDPGRARTVIEQLLGWISQPETYRQLNGSYYAANHLLKTVLELLSNNQHEVDAYNSALIDVCLKHPGSVQIFSPHLSPSACSNEYFLKLYEHSTCRQPQLGSMAMFVLLSKFDLNTWLQKTSKNKQMHHRLISATCSALKDIGKQPDESQELTFDLLKRHIQIELALPDRRRPEEISLVLSKFLDIMRGQSLAPSLWLDFMAILGLERTNQRRDRTFGLYRSASKIKRSTSSVIMDDQTSIISELIPSNGTDDNGTEDTTTIMSLIEDVARLAESQMIFDYHSLNSLIQMLSSFVGRHHNEGSAPGGDDDGDDITLIEFYQDYLGQFSVVMLSVTFMWLKSISETYPNNHELIWKQFNELWYDWVYLNKNCQNVAKSSYNLIAGYYVASLHYMIHKLPDNSQLILQSTLATLTHYIGQTKQVVYLELTILQRCMKNLPWSMLLATPGDFENLATLSEQENYNISDLISHIVSQVDAKLSLGKIYTNLTGDHQQQQQQLVVSRVAERLATTLIIQSAHLKAYRIHVGRYLSLINIDDINRLASLVLSRMEFNVNLEHSQNNRLLVNLLRFMCIKMDDATQQVTAGSNNDSLVSLRHEDANDALDRSNIYARFVSSYLIDLIRRHPSVVKNNAQYLYAILDNSLNDLKLLISPELNLNQKTSLYESLLECCSCDSLDSNARLLLARALVQSNLLKNRPIVVLEILYAVGHILRDGQILVYMLEVLIDLYLNMNGHYEKLWKSFSLEVLPSDIYLNACIEQVSPLALLVYFESLHRGSSSSSGQVVDEETSSTTSSRQSSQFNSNRIWSSFFHWLAQLTGAFSVLVAGSANNTTSTANSSEPLDAKMAAVWLRMLDMLEPNLGPFLRAGADDPLQRINSMQRTMTGTPDTAADQPTGDASSVSSNKSQTETPTKGGRSGEPRPQVSILASHKCLLELIRQLVALFDSVNSGGLWSYLKPGSGRNEQTSRLSIISLSVASLLADRTVAYLNSMIPAANQNVEPATQAGSGGQRLVLLRDEAGKLRKSCLAKLESSRRSKSFVDSAQFLETLVESIQRNDKVHYREGLQLITTYVKSALNPSLPARQTTSQIQSPPKTSSSSSSISNSHHYLNKILPSFGGD